VSIRPTQQQSPSSSSSSTCCLSSLPKPSSTTTTRIEATAAAARRRRWCRHGRRPTDAPLNYRSLRRHRRRLSLTPSPRRHTRTTNPKTERGARFSSIWTNDITSPIVCSSTRLLRASVNPRK
jgi:hypothetical protein